MVDRDARAVRFYYGNGLHPQAMGPAIVYNSDVIKKATERFLIPNHSNSPTNGAVSLP